MEMLVQKIVDAGKENNVLVLQPKQTWHTLVLTLIILMILVPLCLPMLRKTNQRKNILICGGILPIHTYDILQIVYFEK